MSNNIGLISKKFHNKPNISGLLKFKLFAKGDIYIYTTTLKDLFSCFFMFANVC